MRYKDKVIEKIKATGLWSDYILNMDYYSKFSIDRVWTELNKTREWYKSAEQARLVRGNALVGDVLRKDDGVYRITSLITGLYISKDVEFTVIVAGTAFV